MAGSKIVNEHAGKQDADYNQTPTIAYQEGVTQAASEAKARALSDNAKSNTADDGKSNRSMHAARARLGNSKHGSGDAQNEHGDNDNGESKTFRLLYRFSAAQRKAFFQEQNANTNTSGKANQGNPGVKVAARHTQNHAQRATQEDKAANHHYKAKDKAGKGGRTSCGLEFLVCKSHNASANDDSNDFRAQVLHRFVGLQLHSAGGITNKASDANCHVARIAA